MTANGTPEECGIHPEKAAYRSRQAAIAAAIRVSRDLGGMRVYRCRSCHRFHLTTQK